MITVGLRGVSDAGECEGCGAKIDLADLAAVYCPECGHEFCLEPQSDRFEAKKISDKAGVDRWHLHCWAGCKDRPEFTCMRERGHEGPHHFIHDSRITIAII